MKFQVLGLLFLSVSLFLFGASSLPDLQAGPGMETVLDRDGDGEIGEADAIIERARWYAMVHGGQPYLDSGTLLEKTRYAYSKYRNSRPRVDDPGWFNLGPENGAGRATAIAPHPTDFDTFLIGAAGGGVWKTMDGGDTWESLTDGLPDLSVGALEYAPSDPDVVYLGSGEGGYAGDFIPGIGLIRSYDGGQTWVLPDSIISSMFYEINVDPRNPDVLVIGTEDGLLQSQDGGESWDVRIANTDVTDIMRSSSNPDLLYASSWCADGCAEDHVRVWKSIDNGVNWIPASNGLPIPTSFYERMAIALAPSNDQILYAAFSAYSASVGDLIAYVYRTDDGGNNWYELPAVSGNSNFQWYLGYQGWYDNILAISPQDPNVVVAGGVYYIRSEDGGNSWGWAFSYTAEFGGLPHVDAHDFRYQGDRLIVACDGGIYTSDDHGVHWQNKNAGLVTRQYYGMAIDPSNPARIIGGTQDNGTDRRRDDDNNLWDIVLGGDGFECGINHHVPEIAYATVYQGMIFRAKDFSSRSPVFTEISPMYTDGGASFYTPFTVDGANPSVIYTGSSYVWKSIDGGNHWYVLPYDDVSGPGGQSWSGGSVLAIATTPADPDSILVVKGYNSYWSRNRGLSWLRYDGPGYAINGDLSPHDANTAALAFGWSNTGHLMMTEDGGLTWESRSEGLPPYSVQVVRFDPRDSQVMYAGTDMGLYRSVDKGLTWSEFGQDLPNTSIHDLRIPPDGSMLRVATHGRGMWELELPVPANNPPSVQIVSPASGTSISAGESLSFEGSVTDPDGDIVGVHWTFTDLWETVPSDVSVPSITRKFPIPGIYPVSLTAVDQAGASRSVTIRVEVLPSGDMCADPIIIPSSTPFPYTYISNNETATMDFDQQVIPCLPSAGFFASIWLDFTPNETGTYSMDTCGSGGDTVLSLWVGSGCENYVPVDGGCNDDDENIHCTGDRTNSYFEVFLEAENTYHIEVGSYYYDSTGDVRFHLNCLDCSSSAPVTQLIIPASANASGGQGTTWITDVVMVNKLNQDAQASMTFNPRDKNNSYQESAHVSLPANSVVNVSNVVQSVFGLTEIAGAIDLDIPDRVIVSSRTYNNAPDGTYGQFIPAFETRYALSIFDDIYLPYVTANQDFRTNVGITSIYEQPMVIRVEIYDSDGNLVDARLMELAPYSTGQINRVVDDLDRGYIRILTPDLYGRFFAYLSVVDNQSGDPIYIYPLEAEREALVIPAASHQPGNFGSDWITDVDILSPSSNSEFTVSFLPWGTDNTVRNSFADTLSAGQSRRYEDIIQTRFGETAASGSILIEIQKGQLVAGSRTYTIEDKGSYGQYIPAVPVSGAITGSQTAVLSHLHWTLEGYRSNFGLVNVTGASLTVDYVIYSGSGDVLHTESVTLPPYGSVQIDNKLGKLGLESENAWIEVSSADAGAVYFVYASVVDKKSNDPIYVPGIVLPE